jgi:hypothetical protein
VSQTLFPAVNLENIKALIMQKMLFVNGWFAQEGVKINLNPKNGLPLVYLTEGAWIYHGHFTFESETVFEGMIYDRCGIAQISNGSFVDDKLSFCKYYTHRDDTICYEFTLNPSTGLYDGTYDGILTGKGSARLVLINPSPKFFVQ